MKFLKHWTEHESFRNYIKICIYGHYHRVIKISTYIFLLDWHFSCLRHSQNTIKVSSYVISLSYKEISKGMKHGTYCYAFSIILKNNIQELERYIFGMIFITNFWILVILLHCKFLSLWASNRRHIFVFLLLRNVIINGKKYKFKLKINWSLMLLFAYHSLIFWEY